MEKQIKNAIEWLKMQPIEGCISGSALLGYFEGQDVDIFAYNRASFTKLLYAMHHDPMFQLLDPIEKWKFDQFINDKDTFYKKVGILTIKFKYNTTIDVNIIMKKGADNIFSVLSSFDLDIIAKGYDIQTGKILDLSENLPNKKVTWNKWNPTFYSEDIWKISRILRQLIRVFKYHKRGYDTDLVVYKYIELLDKLENFINIFKSEKFDEKLNKMKDNAFIIKQICEKWLETHEISDEEIELMNKKIKEL